MPKVRIKSLPTAAQGGTFPINGAMFPYAGTPSANPYGIISSHTTEEDKNINDSVKPIEPDKANIEAEEGEVLFKGDRGIFKIIGKKHSEGGTPLKVDQGDFIFSDKKDLAITKDEADTFDFTYRKGGKRNNTPAEILKNEVDMKGYNKFLTILNDPKTSTTEKNTASLMLGKMMEKIGQVQYLQEGKKGFPTGLPQTAQGTAPVVDPALQDQQKEQGQFAYGGNYKMDPGGPFAPYLHTPKPFQPNYSFNYNIDVPKPDDQVIPGVTVPTDYNRQAPLEQPTYGFKKASTPQPFIPDQGYNPGKTEWSGMEKLSAALPGLTALSMPTYYDMLQQNHTPNVRLDRIDNQQDINAIQQSSRIGQRELFENMDAKTAAGNAGFLRGQELQAIDQSHHQTNVENTQIANQETMVNAQNQMQDQGFNLSNQRQTFTNNVRARQLRNEAIANGATQSFNNASAVQHNLESLDQHMAAANLPFLTNVYYDKQGKVLGQGKWDDLGADKQAQVAYKGQQGPIGLNGNRMPTFTGFGSLDSIGVTSRAMNNGMQYQQQIIQGLTKAMNSGDPRAMAYAAKVMSDMFKPNAHGYNSYQEMMSAMFPFQQIPTR
jgi:hypothetical protein